MFWLCAGRQVLTLWIWCCCLPLEMDADQDHPSSRRRRTNNLPGAGSGPANSGGRGGGGPLLTTGLAEGVFSMTRAARRTNSASYQGSAAADRNCRLSRQRYSANKLTKASSAASVYRAIGSMTAQQNWTGSYLRPAAPIASTVRRPDQSLRAEGNQVNQGEIQGSNQRMC